MTNKLALIILLTLVSCDRSELYKVKFDNVVGLSIGDPVYALGFKVGQVKAIKGTDDNKTLTTLEFKEEIKLTSGSKFSLHPDLMGHSRIEIDLSDSKDLIDPKQIQAGIIIKPNLREISESELDSLAKINPDYKLMDTITKIFKIVKDNHDKKNKK